MKLEIILDLYSAPGRLAKQQHEEERMKTALMILLLCLAFMTLLAEPNYSDALLQTAQSGDAEAQNDLGLCYFHGYGTVQNDHEAAIWFSSSAEQHFADAEYNLGTCYLEGRGVVRNLPEAKLWLQKAAEQGHELAIALLRERFDTHVESDRPGLTFVSYDDPPVLIGTIQPEYPAFARRAGIQGTVVLEVEVLRDGSIRDIRVRRSVQAGAGGVDEAAVAAIRRVRFQPGKSSGQPVDTLVLVPVTFTLQDN